MTNPLNDKLDELVQAVQKGQISVEQGRQIADDLRLGILSHGYQPPAAPTPAVDLEGIPSDFELATAALVKRFPDLPLPELMTNIGKEADWERMYAADIATERDAAIAARDAQREADFAASPEGRVARAEAVERERIAAANQARLARGLLREEHGFSEEDTQALSDDEAIAAAGFIEADDGFRDGNTWAANLKAMQRNGLPPGEELAMSTITVVNPTSQVTSWFNGSYEIARNLPQLQPTLQTVRVVRIIRQSAEHAYKAVTWGEPLTRPMVSANQRPGNRKYVLLWKDDRPAVVLDAFFNWQNAEDERTPWHLLPDDRIWYWAAKFCNENAEPVVPEDALRLSRGVLNMLSIRAGCAPLGATELP